MQLMVRLEKDIKPKCTAGDPKMLFHTYWAGPMHRIPALSLRSFIHTQHPQCSKLIVWHGGIEVLKSEGGDVVIADVLDAAHGRVEFRELDVRAMAKQTLFEDFVNWYLQEKTKGKGFSGHKDDSFEAGFSDFVRVFVLFLMGGIYFDADVLLLHDMWPLWDLDFSYRWSYLKRYNTAVLGLKPGSHACHLISSSAVATAVEFAKAGKSPFFGFHPHMITKILDAYKDGQSGSGSADRPLVEMLPSPLFDGLWLQVDGYDTSGTSYPYDKFGLFFEDQGVTVEDLPSFFNGAFAYHWHNFWQAKPATGSYFVAFETRFGGLGPT
jgi:hypothetical protein